LARASTQSRLDPPRNCSTDDIIRLLRERSAEIERFVDHEEAAFLALA
jgi:hypothetical protein